MMMRLREAVVDKECDTSDACVQSATVIASMNVVQMSHDSRDAVVRSVGKGTFLIRHRKDHLSSQCPFLGYEVRRIDVVDYHGQSGGDVVARQPAGIAVSACAYRSPPQGCDRDERGMP
jgi:hypothetical protein